MPVASNWIHAEMQGGKQMADLLQQLPQAFANQTMRRAGAKALEIVRRKAEGLASATIQVRTGRWASSFVVTTGLNKNQRRFAAKVSAKEGIVIYVGSTDRKAHLIEFGHFDKAGKFVKAHPTLRPAWDEGKDQVLVMFGEELGKELLKTAARLKKKALRGNLSERTSKSIYLGR